MDGKRGREFGHDHLYTLETTQDHRLQFLQLLLCYHVGKRYLDTHPLSDPRCCIRSTIRR